MTSLISFIILLGTVSLAGPALANAESIQEEQDEDYNEKSTAHVAQMVDIKFWIRDTEFGNKLNWQNQLKPCSLIERIQISERAVISLGDPFDALGGPIESNIRDLALPLDGMLLFEDDTDSSPKQDTLFVQYLNQTGDCFDYPTARASLVAQQFNSDGSIFKFQSPSDDLSWFNSANWASTIYEEADQISPWIPDAHSIPCVEDVVVFGLNPLLKGQSEISKYSGETKSFKVNFRPSELLQDKLANVSVSNLRVSKLKIGERFYNQQEFDELINSNSYENVLFEMDDNHSALRLTGSNDGEGSTQSLLLIDETSIREAPIGDLCLDEAGCLCGNEDVNIMQLICSFNYPTPLHDMPCLDPIDSSGYCNKICGTTLTIIMDPNQFREKFLTNMFLKLEAQDAERGAIFIGNRRIDHHKYEVTFMPAPIEDDLANYETFLGREIELAQMIKEKLETDAIKSFYGIRSVDIRSSVEWRRNNRLIVFWMSAIFILPIVAIVLTKYENDTFKGLLIDILLDIFSKHWSSDIRFSESVHGEQHISERSLILNEIQPVEEQSLEQNFPSPKIALTEIDSQVTSSSVDGGGSDCFDSAASHITSMS